jgi:hypothetical protein
MADPATHIAGVRRMEIIERAVADNLRDYILAYRKAAPSLGADSLDVAGGIAAFLGIGSPITSVKGVGTSITAADVDAIGRFYGDRAVVRVAIETAPWLDQPSRSLLLARGYQEADREDVVVMEKSADVYQPSHAIETVPLEDWPNLIGDAYQMDDSATSRHLCLATGMMPNATLFGIRVDGEWAACASTNPYRDSTILGCDGTVPAFRGMGLQSALIRERLRLLPNCTLAIAEVAPGSGSERNYLRCKFEIAYARTHYVKQLS